LFKKLLGFVFPLLLTLGYPSILPAQDPALPASFATKTEVQHFVKEMHQKHGFDQKYLTELFQSFETDNKVLQLISKQYEALPWYQYQNHVVTQKRVKEGVQFLKENRQTLKRAEKEFGVPAEIIVAIIGIESNYGQLKGKYPVLQSLSTLAFDYPRRANFFKGELEQFLLLTREEKFNPKELLGSFAGAMGMPQFMPSSYRHFAVDFSGKGQRDLLQNTADVIGSVANYFKKHGWKTGESVIHKAKANSKAFKNTAAKTKLLRLEKSKGRYEHWLARYNFYVITRYNHSDHYAMAVYVLSERIRASL